MSTQTKKTSNKSKQNWYSKNKKNTPNQFSKASNQGRRPNNSKEFAHFEIFQRSQNAQKGKKPYYKKSNSAKKPSVKIAFLGGLNEIGKNITLIECQNDIIIVDCGMAFPDGDMLGVDLVIPEESWEQKVRDVHEYHIDTFVIGDDWKGKFDFLEDEGCEVVYLPRTPEISTTQIKKDLKK